MTESPIDTKSESGALANAADLIARLEAATASSIDLNGQIWWVVNRRAAERVYWNGATGMPRPLGDRLPDSGLGSFGVRRMAPNYTLSIDAARKLIPDGFYWIISEGKTRANEPLGGAQIFRPSFHGKPIAEAEHEKVEIALCIAALKARAAMPIRPSD